MPHQPDETLEVLFSLNIAPDVGGALPARSGEETPDASWARGIATGANVRIYATGSLSFVAIDRGLDRIMGDLPKQPGLRQLSISRGSGETFMSPAQVATDHTKFLRLAAAAVNVFVSSGTQVQIRILRDTFRAGLCKQSISPRTLP